jgi:hypothetical protein
MANPKLNIAEIVRCFPGQIEPKPGFPVFNLTSPFDVALRENQLRMIQPELDLGKKVPAHYLLYAQGEPDTREQSRIGGLPYRPRDLEWPADSDGRAKEFVCQIDFSDSRSLLPDLPGEIMLLFASEEGRDNPPFKLEWYPSGLKDLVTVRDLPRLEFTFPMVKYESVFCYLYETYDFPEAKARIKGLDSRPGKPSPCLAAAKLPAFMSRAHPETTISSRLNQSGLSSANRIRSRIERIGIRTRSLAGFSRGWAARFEGPEAPGTRAMIF